VRCLKNENRGGEVLGQLAVVSRAHQQVFLAPMTAASSMTSISWRPCLPRSASMINEELRYTGTAPESESRHRR
jgi:hypothetical protein